jgi:hypothetical protein
MLKADRRSKGSGKTMAFLEGMLEVDGAWEGSDEGIDDGVYE